MHGRWYFDRGHICVYIFLKPFGFWRRQFIESVYVFPETLWILETPIFRSPYLYIYFPWNPLDFGDASSLKVYIFPWSSLDFGDANSSKALICIYIFLKPLDFGDANLLKVCTFSLKPFGFWRRQFIESLYLYIYFPWNPWILETPIHQKLLSTRGPSIPWNSESLGPFVTFETLSPAHLTLYTHQPPHTGSKLCYVRVPRGVG